jgi:hypothetical protein
MDSKPSAAVPRGHAAVSEAMKPNEISIHGFRVLTQKQPILKADPIEEMTKKLGIAPPEMIFGDNYVAIEHEKSGWAINFNSFDALDLVDKTGQSMLQVAYSKEWQKSRYISQTPIRSTLILTAGCSLQRKHARRDQRGRKAVRLVIQHGLQGHSQRQCEAIRGDHQTDPHRAFEASGSNTFL